MSVTTTATQARTPEAIVEDLSAHVWTLVRAQMTDAAVVLLSAQVEEYLRALAEPAPKRPGTELMLWSDASPMHWQVGS